MNYLLLGPEEGEKNDWLKREKERVLKEHPDAEIHSFYTGDDDGAAVSSVMSQPSLFSSFRTPTESRYGTFLYFALSYVPQEISTRTALPRP